MANEDRLIEQAEEIVAAMVDNGIQKSRDALRRAPPTDYDGTCPDCGEDVPDERQALGFYNCVDCQTIQENLMRRGLVPV